MERNNFDIAPRLWDLAKLVTGFAIVQSVALGYKAVDHEFKTAMLSGRSVIAALVITSLFYWFYFRAVRWCHRQLRVRVPDHADTLATISRAQVLAIGGSLLISVVAIAGPFINALWP